MARFTRNPHDLLFKEAWSRKAVAQDYLRHFLPPDLLAQLDLDSLVLTKDSFVDHDLTERFSDLVYRIKLHQHGSMVIYLLFEHKSYRDRQTYFQLVENMVKLWRTLGKQRSLVALPPVLPLLIYHGKDSWPLEDQFTAVYPAVPDSLAPYLLNFQFIVTDFSLMSDHELRGQAMNRVVYLLFKYIFSEELSDRLPEILGLLRDIRQRSAFEFFISVLKYVASAAHHIDEATLERVVVEALPETGERLMTTLAEQWFKQGVDEGLQQGMQQGVQQGMQNAAMQARQLLTQQLLLRFGLDELPIPVQTRLAQASKDQLDRWALQLFAVDSLAAVFV